jgi:acylphosphatase
MIVRHVIVRGAVQGVGYRAWTEHEARRRDLAGWVRNRRNGTVEAVFFGPEQVVASMIQACHSGPRISRVDAVEATDGGAELLAQRPPGERFSVLKTV